MAGGTPPDSRQFNQMFGGPSGGMHSNPFVDKDEEDETDMNIPQERVEAKGEEEKEQTQGDQAAIEDSKSNDKPSGEFIKRSPRKSNYFKISDSNYKWLLEDLNLSNKKRVIDVTDLIENQPQTSKSKEAQDVQEQDHKLSNDDAKKQDSTKISPTKSEKNNEDIDQEVQGITKKMEVENEFITSTEFFNLNNAEPAVNSSPDKKKKCANISSIDSPTKSSQKDNLNDSSIQDHHFISKLYEKLVSGSLAAATNDEEDDRRNDDFSSDDCENDLNRFDFLPVGHPLFSGPQFHGPPSPSAYHYHHNHKPPFSNPFEPIFHSPPPMLHARSHFNNSNGENLRHVSASPPSNQAKQADAIEQEHKKSKPQQKTKAEPNKFSNSFEVSLGDLDDMINRVDNGIKLKRNQVNENDDTGDFSQIKEKGDDNNATNKSENHTVNSNNSSGGIDVDALKKEWSTMFNKLENEYKDKLEEQQRLNDQKLKLLHEEIKKSILEQNNEFIQQQQQQQNRPQAPSVINGAESDAEELYNKRASTSSIPITSISNLNVVDNAKYISNLRMELKTKHARHVQDLKDYYEKELEELRQKLQNQTTSEFDELSVNVNKQEEEVDKSDLNNRLYDDLAKTNKEYLRLNNELNNVNSKLLDKLSDANQLISYLTTENLEMKRKLDEYELEFKNTNINTQNLESCCSQLELQLTDTIKMQDQYLRDLHTEKRNLIKKIQESEELRLSVKFLEQKCSEMEMKLDEKDSAYTLLKYKYIQLEQETNKIDFEYNKLRNMSNSSPAIKLATGLSSQSSKNININHINSNGNGNSTQQLTIKNLNQQQQAVTISTTPTPSLQQQQQQYSITLNSNQSSSATSSSSISPNTNSNSNQKWTGSNTGTPNQLLKILNHNDNINYSNRNNNRTKSPDQSLSQKQSIPVILNEFQYKIQQQQQQKKQHSYQDYADHELNTYYESENLNFGALPHQHQQQSKSTNIQQHQQQQNNHDKMLFNSAEKQLKYIEKLESDFDLLIKHKQQLDAQLTRLPNKLTNTNMHIYKDNIENELNLVEKKLASVKLELRKLNVIKTH